MPVLALAGALFSSGPAHSATLPDALKSEAPEIPADQNHLTRFLATVGPVSFERTKRIFDAKERLDKDLRIEDAQLLQELRTLHHQAAELLKPPVAFDESQGTSATLQIFGLFQGTAILARQAMLEGDYPQADLLLDDVLRWSALLRNGQPSLFQYTISRNGWQIGFNTLLLDWRNHPDQTKRLDEIEAVHAGYRITPTELVEALRFEARWRAESGSIDTILKSENGQDVASMILKPPFDKLTTRELFKLSFDAEADLRRDLNDMLGTLECLKNGSPMIRWPAFSVAATGRTLDDYAKRPNGLGDLFREQTKLDITHQTWSVVLTREPLLESCLLWLKLERDGKPVNQAAFKDFLDPVDGKPLDIDLKVRTIRSRGLNQHADPPDAGLGPLPAAGFSSCGDDSVMVVPKWRTANSVRPTASGTGASMP